MVTSPILLARFVCDAVKSTFPFLQFSSRFYNHRGIFFQEHNPTEMQKMMTKSKVQFDAYDYPRDGYSKDTFGPGKKTYSDKGNFHATIYPRDGPWTENK